MVRYLTFLDRKYSECKSNQTIFAIISDSLIAMM